MPTLTQDQINALKNKGLNDQRIQELATQKGYDLPKQSTLSKIGSALIKSEKGFGQSIAGALGNVLPDSWTGKKAVDESNMLHKQVQDNMLNAIKAKRDKGEDTTRLIDALKTIDKEVNFYDILNTSTGGSLDKSARQVYGEGLGVATDIIGAGTLPGGIGSVTKANTVMQGIKQGAKTGAIGGAIFGGAKEATTAMQDNKSTGEIIGQGLRGAITGGTTGAIAGGILGGVSGGINGRNTRVINREEKHALDLVSPKATSDIKAQALKEGRVTESGIFRPSRITASRRDMELADAVKGVVSSKNSPIQNLNSIDAKVSEINNGVKSYVKANKVPFNTNQLKTQLNKGQDELKLIFASDNNAKKTYDAVVNEFIQHVKTKDTAGLLDARQAFDKIPAIKKLLQSQGLGENAKREIVLTARQKANEYVASLLPKGNTYRASLLQESKMIEAIKNIAEKEAGRIGKSKLIELVQKYPVLKYVTSGAVGAAGVGVGGVILSSTD